MFCPTFIPAAIFQSTPSVGRATSCSCALNIAGKFQSTPSVGRATWKLLQVLLRLLHFNPRPPWGGRPIIFGLKTLLQKFQSTPSVGRATLIAPSFTPESLISIHALRGEGDDALDLNVRRAADISIHALRGEGDDKAELINKINKHFNPRPPWGGRHNEKIIYEHRIGGFQSTPSVGRATAKIYKYAMLCLYIVHIKLYIFATAVLFT